MATYTIDKIGYNGNTYLLQDSGALQLTGGNVTGPVNFGSSVSMDEATIGDLVVNGAASFTNNLQANTINGVTVGSSPKFTDTVYSHPSHTAYSSGLYKITVNNLGHVTAATAVAKADITGLGIPGSDTNTWRAIQVNGTDILGTGTNTNKLNLKAGSNVTITNSNGTVTIASSYTDTNTHYTANLITGASATATSNAANTTTNSIYLNLIENSTVRNSHNIVGSGATTVSCDANGKITISSTDTNTHNTYTVSTTGSGNAVTAVSLSGTTFTVTKGTTFLTSLPSHNHSQIVTVGDQRSTATTPNSYANALIFQGLKNKATIGNPSTDTYSYLVGLRGWSDSSGGKSHELAFNDTGINWRTGSTTTWDAWYKLLTTKDLNSTTSVGTIGSGKVYAIGLDANGKLAVSVPWTDTTYTLSGLGGIGTVSASGTAPLTLSATKSGTAVTITGSVDLAWGNITGKPINFITNTGALNTDGWKTLGGRTSQKSIAISYASSSPATWNSESYSASIVFGCSDTKGMVDVGYNSPIVTFGGGSVSGSTDAAPKWYFKLSGTSGQTYTFPSTSKTLVATDGTGASGTWGISITGSAGSVAWANVTGKPTIPTDTNTWRKVQLNGTDKLGTGISTNPLNLKAGTNVSITESNGTFTFSATDTTYTLSGLGGVGTVTASGTAPLTLSASKSGTTVTITGSISVGTGSNQVAAGNHTHSGYASSTHTHSEYVPMSSTSVDVKSDAFRIRNNQSSATAAAGTNPYVTSLLLGDGREATFDEYGDGYLAIHGKSGIFLHPQSTAISAYDATATYSVGAVVWYDRKYYRCTTAITTAEAWTSGHWTNISASAGNVKVHGDVLPTVTTTYSLGSSSLKWNNVYTNTINGTTVPSSPKFTDTNYYHTSGSWSGLTYTATSNGGAGTLAFTLPTGTTSTTVAVGNHTHDYSSTYAAKSHTHGNLSNDGKITSTATIANGDKIVIVDSDTTAASKITGSSITFDGSTTTKALSQKGTWETFSKFSGSYNDLTNKPTIPTITLNGSSTTSPSFYAPTSAGTSGYYLKSNGSGAPTWAQISTTDTKVTQAYSTASSSYPLLMTATAGTSSTASRGDTTAILNNGLYYTPSSQKLTVGMSVKINNWTWTGEQTSGHLSLIYA